MPLIPVGGRGRWISEFEASQGYTEKPCLGKPNQSKAIPKLKRKPKQASKQTKENCDFLGDSLQYGKLHFKNPRVWELPKL